MGQELFYGVGALVLLGALIYGTIQYRTRRGPAQERGERIVKERYRKDET